MLLKTIEMVLNSDGGSRIRRIILRHIHICFLFTASDFKTIVIPNGIFGVAGALSKSLFTQDSNLTYFSALSRSHLVILWIWLNLFPFNIQNQQHPDSIAEDLINKPWRPLPAKLISREQAIILMRKHYLIAIITSLYLGGMFQCFTLICLGYWYNNQGGSDQNWAVRNLINVGGYLSFITGAINVLNGHLNTSYNEKGYLWLLIVGAIIFTTIQIQDIPDQEGDSLRGRSTMPLAIGDRNARWSIVAGMVFWSLFVPFFWDAGMLHYGCPMVLGSIVMRRIMTQCSQAEDKVTFKVWNLWLISLYMQPLIVQESRRYLRV